SQSKTFSSIPCDQQRRKSDRDEGEDGTKEVEHPKVPMSQYQTADERSQEKPPLEHLNAQVGI
ncbi:MAG: hypothetical protein ACXWHZ_14985, partial [Usitatibacter sp.]